MAIETPARSEASDSSAGLSRRVLRLLKAQVEDWHDECRRLADWEDLHLLEESRPDRLSEHAAFLDELERVGHWISLITQSADFPDRSTAELVAMTLQDLKDARALWHGKTSRERRNDILRGVFNEP